MFGALNRFIGRLDGEPQEQRNSTGDAFGFQILRNNNPELQLEPWFDFIIGINGHNIDNPDANLFATEVHNCAGSTVSLGVWSAKGQKIRELYIPVSRENPSLGVSLQWTPLSMTDNVWHILDVAANSPADLAGLLPYGDYVIGSFAGMMRGQNGLSDLIEAHLDQPLKLLVYNHEYNVTRPVEITPTRAWGGQGALGCTLGFGALHRIPSSLDEGPPPAPGETMFESPLNEKTAFLSETTGEQPSYGGYASVAAPLADGIDGNGIAGGGDFLVPAEMDLPNATSPPPPPGGASSAPPPAGRARKARAHHQFGTEGGLDDLINEGEAASRERDFAPTPKGGSLPPPPKAGAGGPPKSPSPAVPEP